MLSDPNKTQMGVGPNGPMDPNKTLLGGSPLGDLNRTQTIKPIQCPVCKTFNPAGVIYCVDCGLIFDKALDGDAFGAPQVLTPILIDENGREHAVRPGENVVGREGDILINDGRVSRRHAQLDSLDGQVVVSDLGSTNGTKVDGDALTPGEKRPLKGGEKISFGGLVFAYQLPGGVAASATQTFASNKTAAMASAPRTEKAPAKLVGDYGEFNLKSGLNTFGRKPENDVSITDPYVSGKHGIIEVTGQGIFITDTGSTNGTMMNDSKLVPNMRTTFGQDDVLRLGSLTFKIITEPTAEEA